MIRILDKKVADKIAAGEVIDRPVSIVKELLENSLDAGATSITAEIRNGGKTYIRISDNGCGIEAEEASLAFKRHATSKIATDRDLDSIETLGFRGEALASICAVARVELVTKTAGARAGRKVVAEGSDVLDDKSFGCPEGTTITVHDLFYNVPARRKFLASDASETRRIVDLVSRIALSYPDVRFTLINGNRTVFTTSGKGNILNSIVGIYGADLGRDLIPVNMTRGNYTVKGFVSSPGFTMSSRIRQVYCVNGRVITSPIIERAVSKAYDERIFSGRFPVAFLFLAMPASELDVNIHPTKKEIRFDDSSEVGDFIFSAVNSALKSLDAIPVVHEEQIKPVITKPSQPAKPVQTAETVKDGNIVKRENSAKSAPAETADKPIRETVASKIPFPDRSRVAEKPEEYKAASKPAPKNAINPDIKKEEAKQEQVDIKSILTTMRRKRQDEEDAVKQVEERVSKKPKPFEFSELSVIGAVFNTYILASDGSNFYMIDQHAAHERVFYERLRRQYESEDKVSQQLLVPLNFNVAADVCATEESWIEMIRSIGYNIEFFGNNTYIVREIPAFMDMSEAETFLGDMFNEFSEKPDLTNQKIIDRIIMRSCKSAVKAGDILTGEEIAALMKQLEACENPFSCPHGRPTFIRMTKYEIERMFKRT